ncbi:MAG: hypothetical protein AB1552_06135 [Nitrospirota bacterium]
MKYWLIIINSFLHDLVTGFWASTLIVIYLLRNKVPLVHRIPAETLGEITKVFFWLGVFSLIIIIITGFFRTWYYRNMYDTGLESVRKKILVLKHILLGIIFTAGTYWAYSNAYY